MKRHTRQQIQEAIDYWENVLRDMDRTPELRRMVPYRLSDEIFETCGAAAGDFGPLNRDLIYSSNSMRTLMRNESVEYMSEADMKTYPVVKLNDAVCRAISKSMNANLTTADGYRKMTYDVPDPVGKAICGIRYYDIDDGFDPSKDIPGNIVYNMDGPGFAAESFKEHLAEFIKAAHWCGYNYIYSRIENNIFQMSFEPLYNETGLTIGDKLYHIAPSILDAKILKNGLVPKSKSGTSELKFEHPDRVYFFTKYDYNEMTAFARQIRHKFRTYDRASGSRRGISEFSVFEVDVSKLKNANLYRDSLFDNEDPHAPTAVYTYSNVPPSAIRKMTTFDV